MTHVLKRYVPSEENVEKYNEIYATWDSCYSGLSQGTFERIYQYQKKEAKQASVK